MPASSRRNSFRISRSPKTTERVALLGPADRGAQVASSRAAQLPERARRRRRELAAPARNAAPRADRVEQRAGDEPGSTSAS